MRSTSIEIKKIIVLNIGAVFSFQNLYLPEHTASCPLKR